jgi:transcriptional regulator with XRE-family HTH domain
VTLELGSIPATGLPLRRSDGRSSIGCVIRSLRKEKGFSQEELAKRSRVDRTTIARVECGIFKSLSVQTLEGIAAAIGIDLKTLLIKADSAGESSSYRSHLSRIEFSFEYPDEGFRILSHTPKRKEFFFGKIEIRPQKTVPSAKLPHPQQIYLHLLEGKILLTFQNKQLLLKLGDCFAFSGFGEYEFYNPDQFKPAASLFITYPSFLPS